MTVVMNGGKNKGYTIVEVMIFLAISGVMFIIAAFFINGKQAAAAFTQGVNDLGSKLQQIAQEASNGQYPEQSTLSCDTNSGPLSFNTAGQGQGTNSDCVFLGKILHFSPAGDASIYHVIPVAGARLNSSNNTVKNLSEAQPTAVSSLIFSNGIAQGLTVRSIKINGQPNKYAFGFLTSPAVNASGTNIANGAQKVELYYVDGIGSTNSDAEVASAMLVPNTLKRATEVDICFDEGSNRKAQVIIGSSNNALNISVDRSQGITC